jgi:hypothetical protein
MTPLGRQRRQDHIESEAGYQVIALAWPVADEIRPATAQRAPTG